MRLIDADALVLHLAEYQLQESPRWGANGYGNADKHEAITECIEAITDAPTIDAVRVVRCKDCKWYKDDGCFFSTAEVSDDDYCSYGERK